MKHIQALNSIVLFVSYLNIKDLDSIQCLHDYLPKGLKTAISQSGQRVISVLGNSGSLLNVHTALAP